MIATRARRLGEGALGMALAVALVGPGCTSREAPPPPGTSASPGEETTVAVEAAPTGEGREAKEPAAAAAPLSDPAEKPAPRAARAEVRGLADHEPPMRPKGGRGLADAPLDAVDQAAAPTVGRPAVPGLPPGVVATVPVRPPPVAGAGAERPRAIDDRPIDPNGRFATTYRPGGGHLAAFESAVARGIVPATEREIVSDVGARYAPSIPKPTDRALGLQLDLERGKAAPSGGRTHVRIALQSTEARPTERPRLSVHVVFDVSGSMRGELIQNAREAASELVGKLADDDELSLTTFSTDAAVRIPVGPVGPRRREIAASIATIDVQGGTNIGAGLGLGYAQAAASKLGDDASKVVFLLSDGRANEGLTNPSHLSRLALDAFQAGVQTSSFGLGTDYDGPLMSAIAQDGAGGYYYLRDPSQIAPALATELEKRLDPVATAVEVRLRFKPDVQVMRVYGSRRLGEEEAARVRAIEVAADLQAQKKDAIAANRQEDREGGMRFFIPAYARDDAHAILLELALPPGAGTRDVALVELKYKDRVTRKNVTDEVPLKVTYADSDAASAATIDPSMSRTVQGFGAGEALARAARMFAMGDRDGAVLVLGEREGLLHHAAVMLGEPLFVRDAQRLARLRQLAMGAGSDPLVLAMLSETASNVHLR